MATKKEEEGGKKPAVTYWKKDLVACPVCGKKFGQEEMHKGGGRMIAGPLTDELHRVFEPSKKFGRVYPLIYDIGCCPKCNTALFWNDFTDIKDSATFERLDADTPNRQKKVETVFPNFNVSTDKKFIERNLYDGVAYYYLALLSYEKVDLAYGPTFKRALISLRLAWLCKDLDLACPGHNFDYMAEVFYRKALFFYQQTLINETSRIESIESIHYFGPDMDKSYGYDGILYLCGLLEYKYGQREDENLRLKKLSEFKGAIAKLFGLGKSSKEKPGPLLELAKNLYDSIAKELSNNNIFSEDE